MKFKKGDKVMGIFNDSSFYGYDIFKDEPFYGFVEFYDDYSGIYDISSENGKFKKRLFEKSIFFFIKEIYDEAVKKSEESKKLNNEAIKIRKEMKNLLKNI